MSSIQTVTIDGIINTSSSSKKNTKQLSIEDDNKIDKCTVAATTTSHSNDISGEDASRRAGIPINDSERDSYAAHALIAMYEQKNSMTSKLFSILTQSTNLIASSLSSTSPSTDLMVQQQQQQQHQTTTVSSSSTKLAMDNTPTTTTCTVTETPLSVPSTPPPLAVKSMLTSTSTKRKYQHSSNKSVSIHSNSNNNNHHPGSVIPVRQAKKYAPIAVKASEFVFQVDSIILDLSRPMHWLMLTTPPATLAINHHKIPYNVCMYKMTIRIDRGTGQCCTKIIYFNSIYTKQYIMTQLATLGLCSLNYDGDSSLLASSTVLHSLPECFGSKLFFPQQLTNSIMFTDNHKNINVHLANDNDLYMIYLSLRSNALKTVDLLANSYMLTHCCSINDYKLVQPTIEIDLNYVIKERIRNIRKHSSSSSNTSTTTTTRNGSIIKQKTTSYILCLIVKSSASWSDAQVQFFYFQSKCTRIEIMQNIYQYGKMRLPKDTDLHPICTNAVKLYVEKQLEILDALIMRTEGDFISIYITEQLRRNEHYYDNLIGFTSFMYRDQPVFYIDEI